MDGFPWDERIHAGTKAKLKDGTWRQKRGVDPALVEQVKAELAGAAALPASAPSYEDFLNRVTPYTGAGLLSSETLVSICARHGAPDIATVATMPQIIPAILQEVEAVVNPGASA